MIKFLLEAEYFKKVEACFSFPHQINVQIRKILWLLRNLDYKIRTKKAKNLIFFLFLDSVNEFS